MDGPFNLVFAVRAFVPGHAGMARFVRVRYLTKHIEQNAMDPPRPKQTPDPVRDRFTFVHKQREQRQQHQTIVANHTQPCPTNFHRLHCPVFQIFGRIGKRNRQRRGPRLKQNRKFPPPPVFFQHLLPRMGAVSWNFVLFHAVVGKMMDVRVHVNDVGVHVVANDVLRRPQMVLHMERPQVAGHLVDEGTGALRKMRPVVHAIGTHDPVQQRKVRECRHRPGKKLVKRIRQQHEPKATLQPRRPRRFHVAMNVVVGFVAVGGKMCPGHLFALVVERGVVPIKKGVHVGVGRGVRRRMNRPVGGRGFGTDGVHVDGIVVGLLSGQHASGVQELFEVGRGFAGEGVVGFKQGGAILQPLAQRDGVRAARVAVEKRREVVVLASNRPQFFQRAKGGGGGGDGLGWHGWRSVP